jgi:hypothetical protein
LLEHPVADQDEVNRALKKFRGPPGIPWEHTIYFEDWARRSHDLRTIVEVLADLLGVREAIRELPDLEAVRLLQQREGYTPCYGRAVALRPGPDGVCLETGCCWQDFCSPYRGAAVPLDAYLSRVPSQGDITKFRDFLLARGRQMQEPSIRPLAVTVRAEAELEPLSRKLVIGSPHSTICESSDSSNILRPVQLSFRNSTSSPDQGHTVLHEIERATWWSANPERIYNWYASARSLIDASTIDYSPHLSWDRKYRYTLRFETADFYLVLPTLRRLDTPHLGAPNGEVLVSDPNFVPLLNLDIPFLESASLGVCREYVSTSLALRLEIH